MLWPLDAPQRLRDDEMICSDCGKIATCETVDVGVPGHMMPVGPYICECGWQDDADGKANVATYDDWLNP